MVVGLLAEVSVLAHEGEDFPYPDPVQYADDSQHVFVRVPDIDPTRTPGFVNNWAELFTTYGLWVLPTASLVILIVAFLHAKNVRSSDGSMGENKIIMTVSTIPMLIWLALGFFGATTSDEFTIDELNAIQTATRADWNKTDVALSQGKVESAQLVNYLHKNGNGPVACNTVKSDFDFSTNTAELSCIYSKLDVTPNIPWITFPNIKESDIIRSDNN